VVQSSLRQMTRHGRLTVGTFIVELNTPGIGQILRAGGCEYVLLDLEHSGFGIDTLKRMLRSMQAAEMPTIVPVPSREYHHAASAMDAGAEGIMMPMIGSTKVARELLSYLKYPPEDARGVALQIAHDRYAPGPVLDKLKAANKRTTFLALIETAEGVEHAEEIAALKGVDALWVGHFDLTVSMALPGRFDHAEFVAAVNCIAYACRTHKESLGRIVPNSEAGAQLFRQGFDFICHSADAWMLQQAMRRARDPLRAACTGGRKWGGG